MPALPKVFDLPESKEEIAIWLEDKFTGDDFAMTVESLSAIQSGGTKNENLCELSIGEERVNEVLEFGLRCLTRTEVFHLLQNPRELYLLQEQVYKRGGEYWESKFNECEPVNDKVFHAIEQVIGREGSEKKQHLDHQSELVTKTNPNTKTNDTLLKALSILGALAASVLIFLGGSWFGRSQAETELAQLELATTSGNVNETETVEWGWNRTNALEIKLERENKLNHIANLLAEWNSVKPNNANELLVKAKELRKSCDVLLAAKLSDLTDDDVRWLKQECAKWSTKIDGQLASLSDPKNYETAKTELNRLVHKSIFEIRNRARKT